MKLIRFGEAGAERPGLILADGRKIDASAFGEDWNEAFFGSEGLSRLAAWAKDHAASAPEAPAGVRLGPAIARPSKLICIGLNFKDHAEETGQKAPAEPIIFSKATSAWSGPNDDVTIPSRERENRLGSRIGGGDWQADFLRQ